MGAKDSWFKFVIDKWFGGTRRLSFAAKGLYVDLITLFRDGKAVPNDSRAIAELLNVRDHRSVNKPLEELLKRGKIKVDAQGNLYNERADIDMADRARKRSDDEGGGGQGGEQGGGQPSLPFRPHVVHRSVDDAGKDGGRRRATPDQSAVSPRSDREVIANWSRIFWPKSLISLRRDSTSESQSHRENQSLVAAIPFDAPRARDGPRCSA